MIAYDRRAWWRTCFAVSGTVLPHVLGRVGLLTLMCLALCFLDRYVLENLDAPLPSLDQLGHNVLGIALSLLIVFRTNASNARYWEARAAWGDMVNASRNLTRLAVVYAPPAEEMARLIAAYPLAVKQFLRSNTDLSEIRPLVSGRLFERLESSKNPPMFIARAISQWIERRRGEGKLDSVTAQLFEQQVVAMVNARGGCERIQRTPLPFVYAALIKQLLFLYLATLPFVLVTKMGFAAPLVVAVVALAMLGIEEAGVEIEAPFGLDDNHLPLEQIAQNIARDTAALVEVD